MFAEKCRQLRKTLGLTQDQLAHKVGLKGKQAISNWENGDIDPTLASAIQVADVFGVTLDTLISDQDKMVIDITELPEEMQKIVSNLVYNLRIYHKKNTKQK